MTKTNKGTIMALVICYECNQKVSSFAKSCPHCGAPLKPTADNSNKGAVINVESPPISNMEPIPGSMVCIDCKSKFNKIYPKCPSCGSSNRITATPDEKMISTNIPKKISTTYVDGIKCPACGKEAVQKITAANKVGSALTFGIFSLGHIAKTFKCARCGYKF
jgi:predicted amidophosphoribosyltransferase